MAPPEMAKNAAQMGSPSQVRRWVHQPVGGVAGEVGGLPLVLGPLVGVEGVQRHHLGLEGLLWGGEVHLAGQGRREELLRRHGESLPGGGVVQREGVLLGRRGGGGQAAL